MNRFSKHIFLLAITILILSDVVVGQLSLVGSNGCNCNGELSYSWSTGEAIVVDLTDYGNQFIQSNNSSSGTIQFQNLCPRVHSLHISGLAAGDTTLLFNIEDITSPLPTLSNEIICYSEAGQDDIIDLADIAGVTGSSFQWTVPGNYQAINGDINVNDMSTGLFLYTAVSSSCSKSSGLFIDYYNNSAGTQTGSLLICESEVDSIQLITLLGGSPAPNGYWTFEGQEFNGVFYPATMEGGFSNRFYYNVYVPECGITNIAPATIIERLPPNPGFSLTNQNWYCQSNAAVNMFELLGGSPQRGGTWSYISSSPNALVSGIDSVFVPGQSQSGVYEYSIIPSLPCVGTYKSTLTISYYPDPSPGVDLDTAVCSSSDTLFLKDAIGAPAGYSGIFTDNSGMEVDSIFVPAVSASADLTYSINPFGCGVKSAAIHIETFQDIDAGDDVTINLCTTELPVTVTSIMNGSAEPGGAWYNPNGIPFDGDITENLASIELNYILGNAGCGLDTSVYQVTIDQPLNFTPLVTTIQMCAGDDPVNLLSVLGSSDLYFTNASNDVLPIVVYPDSMVSSVIQAHLNSDNSCPGMDFPVAIEVQSTVLTNTIIEFHICASEFPLSLSEILEPDLSNAGIWYNEQSNVVSLVDIPSNDSATYTFQLSAPPICGSDFIAYKLFADTELEGHSNSTTTKCLSDSVFDLASLVDYDNSGFWTHNNLPVANTLVSQGVAMNQQYEYRILSSNSCPDAVSVHQLEIRSLPNVSAGNDIQVCMGDTVWIGSQSIPGYNYQWTPTQHLSNGTLSTTSLMTSTDGEPTSLAYVLTANDGFCSNSDSIVIALRSIPVVAMEDSAVICNGASVTIDPISDGIIEWHPAQGITNYLSPSQTLSVSANQVLYLSSTNSWGCTRQDSILLHLVFPPKFSVSSESISSCSPLAVIETIDSCDLSDASFRWIIPGYDTLFGNIMNTTLRRSGVFDLVVEAYSSEGCMADTLLNDIYEVFPNPISEFDGYQDNASNLRQEIVFSNESENALNFEWSINGEYVSQMIHLSQDFEGFAPGNYQVCLLAKSVEGCRDSICHDIHLVVEQVVYAPSAFTPNGDGTNDGFKPVINGFSPEMYEFLVADKWGNIIFKSNNPEEYWIGEVDKGDYYSQNGVYNWMLKAKKFDNADVEIYRGSVMMIR